MRYRRDARCREGFIYCMYKRSGMMVGLPNISVRFEARTYHPVVLHHISNNAHFVLLYIVICLLLLWAMMSLMVYCCSGNKFSRTGIGPLSRNTYFQRGLNLTLSSAQSIYVGFSLARAADLNFFGQISYLKKMSLGLGISCVCGGTICSEN